jgi:hypothetical protein
MQGISWGTNSLSANEEITHVGFDVFTAVTMKNALFWDVTPCASCMNRRFEENIASIIRMRRISELGTLAVQCTRASVASYC